MHTKRHTHKPGSIADQLRQAMDNSGWSNSELARRSGVDKAILSRFRNGITSPKMANLERLAVALDLRLVPAHMVDEEDED